MFKFKQLFFLLFIISNLTAQISGVVKDSLTGKPIPYVNIWVENENIGTTSNEKGFFDLVLNENKNIVFSALGYETKIISSLKAKSVLLNPKIYQLEEVVVENLKKTKELEIGDAKKIHHTQLSGDKPWIYGKLFPFQEKYNETPYIKSISFYSNSEIKDAKLKIRIYEMNDSIPSNDLLYEELIVSVKKGMRNNKIDVSKNNIKFSEKGIVIGLEWLIIDENKYVFEYKSGKSKNKNEQINYAPSLVINYSETKNSFRYYGGKWVRNKIYASKKDKPWDNKVMTPAINLTLTN
ncbi:carboxypeptidase-like regulatory domain-containing protein [Flavobacterium sp. UBA6135]|uniref:carboxypeptidase-like regulatory domain-containing protein n=1 Tax=Flavobacterium sp. UBA6135 TaxID=1946553 RepID=UPI0025C739CD|nr:carboxypeptidase-like regulatory domain-containing protein [Flavobacterium sp. UBA6135]